MLPEEAVEGALRVHHAAEQVRRRREHKQALAMLQAFAQLPQLRDFSA